VRKILVLLLTVLTSTVLFGQEEKPKQQKIYKFNYKTEIPITLGLHVFNLYGQNLIDNKKVLEPAQVLNLSKKNVWRLDRQVLYQSISQRSTANTISDWGMYITLVAPSLLFLDDNIRSDWKDIVLLYLETQGVSSNLFAWSGALNINRSRPLVYYSNIPMEEKTGSGTLSSFFSGHTSTTATASFFTAKVFADYHPELGGKKNWLYAAALIPPAFVGYYRIRALKHFPTDVLTGTIAGAAVGILVPHFHKIVKRRNKNLTIVPFTGENSGLCISYKF